MASDLENIQYSLERKIDDLEFTLRHELRRVLDITADLESRIRNLEAHNE